MKKFNRKGKGLRRERNATISGPDTAISVYRGPSRLPRGIRPDTYEVELHLVQSAVTVTTTGVYDTNITSALTSSNTTGAGVSNAASWASISGNYREYRVLAIRAEYTPAIFGSLNSAAVATVYTLPFATVVDRDDSSNASTISNIEANESLMLFPVSAPFMRQAKMESMDESQFETVGSSAPGTMTIKSLLTGGPVAGATTFGYMLYRWVVQFRTLIG